MDKLQQAEALLEDIRKLGYAQSDTIFNILIMLLEDYIERLSNE